jgi:hypothetical protein
MASEQYAGDSFGTKNDDNIALGSGTRIEESFGFRNQVKKADHNPGA